MARDIVRATVIAGAQCTPISPATKAYCSWLCTLSAGPRLPVLPPTTALVSDMFGVDRDLDNELLRVWQLVHELSEQLAHNQKVASTLQSQAGALKVTLS